MKNPGTPFLFLVNCENGAPPRIVAFGDRILLTPSLTVNVIVEELCYVTSMLAVINCQRVNGLLFTRHAVVSAVHSHSFLTSSNLFSLYFPLLRILFSVA